MTRDIVFVGTGSGWGATNMGTGKGPQILLNNAEPYSNSPQPFSSLSPHPIVLENFHNFDDLTPYFPFDTDGKITRQKNLLKALGHHFEAIFGVLQRGLVPFSIGGDHSLAIATWAAVKQHYSDFGLIWIDAHLDAHTPETTPSHAAHGMPAASLLGYAAPEFKELMGEERIILPENLVYIGARSFEEEEHALLKELGVKIYCMDEVKARGFSSVFNEAKAHVTRNTPSYGISLDIDAFDPLEVPGTGAKVAEGLIETDVIPSLLGLIDDPHLICFEMMEFNPDLDEENRTLAFLWRVTKILLGETNGDESIQDRPFFSANSSRGGWA
ncbi:arginase [Candidatus Paracaedibacter symbiosus]|uniref:arginase n=1 Tax=Candidatus Paracaedibacter symbiosus TaxID=244582 RepID=UPI00068AEFFB|nr:arginase [Candidatus Paracaedibacter symbiosus]